jgi:hypothetical protein
MDTEARRGCLHITCSGGGRSPAWEREAASMRPGGSGGTWGAATPEGLELGHRLLGH